MAGNNVQSFGALTLGDFAVIGDVAPNCDLNKIKVAEQQARVFDLIPLTCGWWNSVLSMWQEYDDWKKALDDCIAEGAEGVDCNAEHPKTERITLLETLLYGGTYEGCKDNEFRNFVGAKAVSAYFTYSRYLRLNRLNDTPNGAVLKAHDYTENMSYAEIKSYQEQFFNMGMEAFKWLKDWICRNPDLGIEIKDCKACGCSKDVCTGETARSTNNMGMRIRNVSKTIHR